jgi:hypothetical protein
VPWNTVIEVTSEDLGPQIITSLPLWNL